MITPLRPIHYFLISILALIAGFLFYCLYNNLIIVSFQFKKRPEIIAEINAQKKSFKLIYWHKNKWNIEEKELLSSDNKAKTIDYLIKSWLSMLHDEHILIKDIDLQSIMLDKSGAEVYISFDHNPLNKKNSTFEKLMFIEGLLKTIRTNKIALNKVYFLVNHKPLIDYHLDFSQPWPLSGFIEL